ncbi:MAG: GHKL domain-containing protein [Deltaproteobacteria bacterium]|nr:GHKL domain-containing protein [Deltaproteobacteria bacterium]MBW1920457.1 GHKL domain-containing protein [Deltaproteobacteria bacterium]RLB35875.1 MAG: two-component sensor histidine kinase [Deltaproteobacteria bacterium]
MIAPSQSVKQKPKQFRLVKYFAVASFIVLVIFSFPFSVVISQKAKEALLESYENSALLVGENLNQQVFRDFVLPVTRQYGVIRLRDKEQQDLMDRVVRNAIHGFKVDLVNIHSINQGVIAYSTDPSLIGHKTRQTIGYKKAVMGESFSSITSSRYDLLGLGIEILGSQKKIRSYIPFMAIHPFTGERYVAGIFELIQDVSQEYHSIVRFQYLIFGLSILIMGLIFLALLLIVHKAERIIEQRMKEQQELEAQLHQAERLAALGEMVAGVSHEIKNPLGIIRSTAELLSTMPGATDTQKKLSEVINEESNRLNRIVTEFLDFARPQVPRPAPCDLGEIIKKNLLFLGPELKKRDVKIQHNLDEKALGLMADEELLYRALLNLLINAIQSIDGSGTIDIRVEQQKDRYLLQIQDTGSGISPENLKRVFDPFFTTKEKGTGLGLAIVRKIIENHNGNISVESREGQGTNVKIWLPSTM